MSFITQHFNLIMTCVVLAAWGFIFSTMVRLKIKHGIRNQEEYEIDHLAFIGYVTQIIAFVFLLLEIRLDFSQPIVEQIDFAEQHKNPADFGIVSGVILSLSLLSAWFINDAMSHLDKQWTFKSGMFRDHRFISEGPYRFVRHPIYVGYLGMLIATGLALTTTKITLIAIVIYLVGTYYRAIREEKLMQQRFGNQYLVYCQHVPRLLPKITV